MMRFRCNFLILYTSRQSLMDQKTYDYRQNIMIYDLRQYNSLDVTINQTYMDEPVYSEIGGFTMRDLLEREYGDTWQIDEWDGHPNGKVNHEYIYEYIKRHV